MLLTFLSFHNFSSFSCYILCQNFIVKRTYTKAPDRYSHRESCCWMRRNDCETVVTAPTSVQGVRKVKHVTVNLTSTNTDAFHWAIVFVPAGTSPSPITTLGASMYDPNQFVMSCGTIDPAAGPIHLLRPVSRKASTLVTLSRS